jgi:hypothetical protein
LATLNKEKFASLKSKLKEGKLSTQNVDDIFEEVIEQRQPLRDFIQMRQKICCKPLLNIFLALSKVVSCKCCLSYDNRRELQAERKFNNLCDIIRILKTVQTAEIVSRLLFSPEQKILSKL